MQQYIGTKIVHAEPAKRFSDGEKTLIVESDRELTSMDADFIKHAVSCEEGYRVVYSDGYRSWSPKDVFEAAYRPTDNMSFGLAIEVAKMGKKIQRAGWNGKRQYVELATRISYVNADSVFMNVEHADIGNEALAFVGTSGVQMGWLASQADMLADDWRIVE